MDKERSGALYLHNLASAPGARGAGAALLDYCQQWAQEHGYQVLRLDCRADNQALNEYYSARGFRPVGFCTDRTHRGTLREKEL